MNPLHDFKAEIKLFAIVAAVSVVIAVGGILLLKSMQPASTQPTIEQKQQEIASEETTQSKLLVTAFVESVSRGERREFEIEDIDVIGYKPTTSFHAYHVLVVKNITTEGQRVIELRDLIDEQTFSYVRNLEENRTPPTLILQINENFLAIHGGSVWGRIDLFTSGDPPIPFVGNYFKIDAETGNIETFEAPTYAATIAIHPQLEMALYDTFQSGLLLKLRNLRTGEEKVVVSYPVELLEEHIIYAALGYRYPGFGQQESRQLQPEWIDENTISYLDFETRERVVVNLDTLGWQTYRNEEFGFEMKYPEEWTIMEGWGSNFEPSLVSFVNPDSTKLYKESADINVYVYRLEELGLPDLTSYLDNSERGLYDIEEILLGSYTGYEAWVPGHDTAYSIFVEHDEHIYEFHLESVFDLNDITDMERQILSTFRFVY